MFMQRNESTMARTRRWAARRAVRRAAVAGAAVAIGTAVVAGAGIHAGAYGPSHLYQITLAEQCENPTTCVASDQNPFGIGGIWGWIEPDAGGTADTQVTAQGHSNSNTALNGPVRFPSSWNWTIISIPPPPILVSPPDPNGHYFHFTITSLPGFEFLTPATPGHYNVTLGPGISAEITVTQLH